MIKKESQLDELIQLDWKKIKMTHETSIDMEVAQHLFLQAVVYNARNGSSLFQQRRFPNAAVDDVVRSLKMKGDKLKTVRQRLINDLVHWIEDSLGGNGRELMVNDEGLSLFRLTPLSRVKVNPLNVLRGIYIWGKIKDFDLRQEAERKYNIEIGSGNYYIVNMTKMNKYEISADDLEHFPHEDMIEFYKDIGLITTAEKALDSKQDKIKYFYIRHALGPGLSVDIAIILAGLMFNIDTAYGVLLGIALDTFDKYVHLYMDYAAEMSMLIEDKYSDLNISKDDLLKYIYSTIMPRDEDSDFVPNSSLIDLFTIDNKSGMYPFECYKAFLEKKPTPPITIGPRRILSLDFFRYINRRLVESQSILNLPSEDFLKINKDLPSSNFATDGYVVIKATDPISKGISKMIQEGKDILIIIEEDGKLKGVLHTSDILRLFEQ